MALSIPNTFSDGTPIEGTEQEENLQAVKQYINGGVISSDIKTNEQWASTKHFMKGIYFPTDNHNEMVSGLYKGPAITDLPTFNPGYTGKFISDFTAGNGEIPGTAISFFLEKEADIMLNINISPRGMPILVSSNDGAALTVILDGDTDGNNYGQMHLSKEVDLSPTSGTGADIYGFYRRRYYQSHIIFPTVSAGYHSITLASRSNLRAVPLKFYTYSMQAFYRT